MKVFASLSTLALAAVLTSQASAAGPGADPEQWPYPEDIPVIDTTVAAQPIGADEADLVRFYKVRRATGGTISPDGKTLAFKTDTTGIPQLWTVSASGGTPKQMTYRGAVGQFYWAPDSSGLVYFSDTDGDELTGFSYISADGKTERPLQGAGEAFTSFGDFSSDAKTLMFSTTKRNGNDYDLYVQDLKGGAAEEVYRGTYGWFAQAWQPGGRYVVVTETRGEDGRDLYLFNVETKTMIPIYQPQVAANFDQFEWTQDGKGFYLATNLDREYQGLAYYDLASGELSFIAQPQADVDEVSLGGNDTYLAYVINKGGYSSLKVRNLKTGKDVALPKLPAGVYSIEVAQNAPTLQISISSPQIPSDVWVYDFENETLVRATNSSAAGLDLGKMVAPEAVAFKAQDGVELHGLYYPPREAQKGKTEKPPVVLRLHGGPTGQAKPTFNATLQYLLARGYAVLDLNFRGSTGFGKTFARLDDMRNRADAVRDIKDAMTWLEESGRVDTSRAAVMGGSYGGYLVNAVLGDYPDLFSAGVSFVGVSNWVRALEEASPSLKASDRLEYGDISDPQDRKFFASISPINKADKIKAPVLVVHGANDPRDPVTESDALVKKIREAGGSATYIRLSDEGHSIQKLNNRVYTYTRVGAFLDTHLMQGSDAAPVPAKTEEAAQESDPSVAATKTSDGPVADQLADVQAGALAEQQARDAAEKKVELEGVLAKARKNAETASAGLAEKQGLLQDADVTLYNAQAAVKAFETSLSASQTKIDEARANIAEAEAALKEAKETLAQSTAAFDQAQADRSVAAEALQAAQRDKDEAQAAADAAEAASDDASTALDLAEKADQNASEKDEARFLERAGDVVKSAIKNSAEEPAP